MQNILYFNLEKKNVLIVKLLRYRNDKIQVVLFKEKIISFRVTHGKAASPVLFFTYQIVSKCFRSWYLPQNVVNMQPEHHYSTSALFFSHSCHLESTHSATLTDFSADDLLASFNNTAILFKLNICIYYHIM